MSSTYESLTSFIHKRYLPKNNRETKMKTSNSKFTDLIYSSWKLPLL